MQAGAVTALLEVIRQSGRVTREVAHRDRGRPVDPPEDMESTDHLRRQIAVDRRGQLELAALVRCSASVMMKRLVMLAMKNGVSGSNG